MSNAASLSIALVSASIASTFICASCAGRAPGGGDAGVDAGMDMTSDAGGMADGGVSDGGCVSVLASNQYAPTPLVISGESAPGMGDPSLLWPAGSSTGLLAYTAASPGYGFETHVAASDGGAGWQFLARANAVTPITVSTSLASVCDAGSCSGFLFRETPSLIEDPTDPDPTRRYKLFFEAYPFFSPDKQLVPFGYIGLETSADGTSWSSDVKLLGQNLDMGSSLADGGVLINVNQQYPALADCLLVNEPGAVLAPSGAIDLALGCPDSTGNGRVELLRSTDHGQTFSYVGRVLSPADATCLGGAVPQVLEPDLFYVGSTEYVVVSVVGDATTGLERGCFVLPFSDPVAGLLERDAEGGLVVSRELLPSQGDSLGACTYAEGAPAVGYMGHFQTSASGLPSTFESRIGGP